MKKIISILLSVLLTGCCCCHHCRHCYHDCHDDTQVTKQIQHEHVGK